MKLNEISKLDINSEFFENIIDILIDTVFIFDPNTKKALKWNKAFREVSGYTDVEISGKKAPDEWYSKEDLKKAFESTKKIQRGERITTEMSLITKNGETVPFEYAASVITNKKEKTEYIISIGRSLTERKIIEQNLKESEERYRNFIANATEGIFRIDFHSPIDIDQPYEVLQEKIAINAFVGEVNTALSSMYGLTPEDMIGKPVRIYAPNCGTQMADLVQTEDYKFLDREEKEVDSDGNPIYIIESYRGVVEEGILKRVWGVQRNITKNKLIEQEILQEKIFTDTIINSLPGIFFVFDFEGRIVRWNKAHQETLGFSDDEMKNRIIFDVVEEDRELVMRKMGDVLSKGQATLEARLLTKKGVVPFLLHGVRMDTSGKTYIVGSGIDITERIEMERKLLHVQKLESLGVLAGGIAHDFNNLLMAIMGSLDLISMDLPGDDKIHSTLETAINATKRASNLTHQMLAYSGQGSFMPKKIDLGDLLKENADIFRTAIKHTINMKLNLSKEDVVIEADPGQIQQVIMNLITNAAEAIEDAPGTITISSGIKEYHERDLIDSQIEERPNPGNFAYFEISDTGKGMDKSIQRKMFDPFFTTKFTGRGLGMSAVLGIIRGHNGAIFVYSEVGKGTTIRVLFPLIEETNEERIPIAKTIQKEKEEIIQSGKILIVDDDDDVRNTCRNLVEYIGYQTITAADGSEALEKLKKNEDKIILVILDLTMPNLDGVKTFKEMRKNKLNVPVLLSSGFTEQEAIGRFNFEGLSGFIQKPYHINSLKNAIYQALKPNTKNKI
jgi:PAS domain S-box-containing protein